MSAAVLSARPRRVTGISRRRRAVSAELLVAVAICLVGYYAAAGWFRVHEAAWTVDLMHLLGIDRVSGTLPGDILMFPAHGAQLTGTVTTSCSAILAVVGLTALTATVLRERHWHAVGGLLAAAGAVVLANELRLVASTLAGLWWGQPAMVLFHDWVGTVWTLAATLGGFLLMVCIALPPAERAEQSVAGRHTARRPNSWARPGLGYRVAELDERAPSGRRTLTGLLHRYVLPRAVSRRLAARRESARVDYRIGHLPAPERTERVQALVADGLGAHTASLLAIATYDEDPTVLDALALAIAARQWEPVTNDRVAGLRLWARGWLLGRSGAVPEELPAAGEGADDAADEGADLIAADSLPVAPAVVPGPRTGDAGPADAPVHSFARPASHPTSDPAEDER